MLVCVPYIIGCNVVGILRRGVFLLPCAAIIIQAIITTFAVFRVPGGVRFYCVA